MRGQSASRVRIRFWQGNTLLGNRNGPLWRLAQVNAPFFATGRMREALFWEAPAQYSQAGLLPMVLSNLYPVLKLVVAVAWCREERATRLGWIFAADRATLIAWVIAAIFHINKSIPVSSLFLCAACQCH